MRFDTEVVVVGVGSSGEGVLFARCCLVALVAMVTAAALAHRLGISALM